MAADPRSRRRGTVRTRTTVAATLAFALALLTGGTVMLSLLHRSLVRNLDDVADIRSDDIAALARRGALPPTLSLEDDAVGQVVDAQGGVVAATANITDHVPIAAIHPAGAEPVTRTVDDLPGVAGEYRLLTLRATSPGGPVTILVGTNLEPVRETLLLVRTSMLVAASVLLGLVATMTWITVGRALHPVEAIRSHVAHLSSTDRRRRVPVPRTDDEIGRLAATMNAMLDRLQAASDKQNRFVADASHELQSPLAAARTDLEVALAYPDATNWSETARDLLEENRRMERLVADLLFIARTDDTAAPEPGTPVDLHEIVHDEAARLSGSNDTHIDTTAVTSAFVRGRRDDLTRAVRNLLDNAQHHATTTVTIELSNSDGAVTLAIEDDGPGIQPEHRDRIFERFARLDTARTRNSQGTGLGLAIVKDIVEHHHGDITVHDSRPPHGARFVVTLPSD